jgi:hypothetical protein
MAFHEINPPPEERTVRLRVSPPRKRWVSEAGTLNKWVWAKAPRRGEEKYRPEYWTGRKRQQRNVFRLIEVPGTVQMLPPRKRRGGPTKPRWLQRQQDLSAFEAKRARENERKRRYEAERRAIYAAFRELNLIPANLEGERS